MVNSTVILPEKWDTFLKRLADDHQIDLNIIIRELCEWAFSNSEGKRQFEAWLDDAFPTKGDAENRERNVNEAISEEEEEAEEESEAEGHEHRD